MSKKGNAAPEPADELLPPDDNDGNSVGWLATFADLMALLMCFFVLLLSFSEIDVIKYKQVAGSLKFAFGLQREIEADQIPKAESVVKQEFSPGKPEPTIVPQIRQQTADEMRRIPRAVPDNASAEEALAALAQQVREKLAKEIEDEALELVVGEGGIMIRVREKDAFPSGSARLQPGFRPVLDKLVDVLNDMEGNIVVSGHTDNLPIDTWAFPSNWVLSSARAASVVHHLASADLDDPSRIEIRAYADTRPIVPNDSRENRARNRRVEIDINVEEN